MRVRHPRRPLALVGAIVLGVAICAILVLRLLILFGSAGDPVYNVRQVVLEQGFVPWEGERLGVHGLVLPRTTGCNGPALEIADPNDPQIRLSVAYSPSPRWLSAITEWPGMSLLVPPGLSPSPHGMQTIKGRLTLVQSAPCPSARSYMLIADRFQ